MGMEERFSATTVHGRSQEEIPYGVLGLAQDSYSGPAGSVSLDGGGGITVTLVCRWRQLAKFCETILGENYVDTEDTTTRLFRWEPLVCPIYSFTTNHALRVVSFGGIPGDAYTELSSGSPNPDTRIELPVYNANTQLYLHDGYQISTTSWIEYEFASVTVEFGPLPYRFRTNSDTPYDKEWQRFTTVERTPRVELLNVKAGILKWVDDPPLAQPVPVPTDMPIRVQAIDYVVTWHRVPFVITDLADYVGYANSADGFLEGHEQIPTSGFPKDRMLMLGFRETRVPQLFRDRNDFYNASALYTYQFYFQEKANKHNNSLRRKGNEPNGPFTFEYNDYSFTGRPATLNTERAIKHANLAQLFQARS
jgi:hypothetical protein